MSSRRASLLLGVLLATGLGACASGGAHTGDDTQQVDARVIDARVFVVPDGQIPRDSSVLPPDASTQLPDASIQLPDADMSGGPCAAASDCTDVSNPCCSIITNTCGADPGFPANIILCAP